MKEELSLHLPDGSIWFDQHFAAETGVHIFLISPQCVSLSWSQCIHSAHWQAHEMWEFWAASLGLRSLLCITLMFSDFEGKAFSYSQIMVHCSIMQVASYKCFPFTRGQAQQPETFGCACGFARSENQWMFASKVWLAHLGQAAICIVPSHVLVQFSPNDLQLDLS